VSSQLAGIPRGRPCLLGATLRDQCGTEVPTSKVFETTRRDIEIAKRLFDSTFRRRAGLVGIIAIRRYGCRDVVARTQMLDEKEGSMLDLIDRYKHVPRSGCDPLDAQVKRETGFSLSEATNPDSSAEAAVATLCQLRDRRSWSRANRRRQAIT
jgi:hypothetical protein